MGSIQDAKGIVIILSAEDRQLVRAVIDKIDSRALWNNLLWFTLGILGGIFIGSLIIKI